MATKTIKTRIVNKHSTESDWKKAINFVPLLGELIIYDPDEMYFYSRFKIGNGISNVNDLPFVDGLGISNTIDAGNIATYEFEDMGIIDAGALYSN